MRCRSSFVAILASAVLLHFGQVLLNRFRGEIGVLYVLLHQYTGEVPDEYAEAALEEQRVRLVTLETRSNKSVLLMPGVFGKVVYNVGARVLALESWRVRALAYRDWLEEQAPLEPDRLVVLTDAADVVFGGCDDERLVAAYNATVAASGGARVVFGAEFGGWPKNFTWDLYRRFEGRKAAVARAHGLAAAPYDGFVHCGLLSGYCPTQSYEFLNAGFVMGPVSLLLKVLTLLLEELQSVSNYQLAAHRVLVKHSDDVTLDYTGSLVLNIGHFARDAVGTVIRAVPGEPGSIHNAVLQATQCFIHGQSFSGKLHVNNIAWQLLRRGYPPEFPILDFLWRLY